MKKVLHWLDENLEEFLLVVFLIAMTLIMGIQVLFPLRTWAIPFLLVLNCFLLIVGMVMDTTPAILILTPILLPIIEAIGMDPIQFGVNF